MKTKKLLSVLMATVMTMGVFAPTVAFAQDVNSINTEVVQQEQQIQNSTVKFVDLQTAENYHPEDNSICFESYVKFYNENRTIEEYFQKYDIKINVNIPIKDIPNECFKLLNNSSLLPQDYFLTNKSSFNMKLPIWRENNWAFVIDISSNNEAQKDKTIKEIVEEQGAKLEEVDDTSSYFKFEVKENEIVRKATVKCEAITEEGKVLTQNELPNLNVSQQEFSIIPKDPFDMLNNKYFNFDNLLENSKFTNDQIVNKELIMNLKFKRSNRDGIEDETFVENREIIVDPIKDNNMALISFEELLLDKWEILYYEDNSVYYNKYLDSVDITVRYTIKEFKPLYDAETGTMASKSSYEVVTEDGKTLTNVELPNLPANNYEEKIDVNKELEDSLEFYEDNYLNTIDDDEIEEEKLNIHMVLNDGNVFDILIDEDDDLYDDITLKGLVESKGYKLEDVKEYRTKYVFVLDDDVFKTDEEDDDDEDEFDEEDFEEDDDDDDDDEYKVERKHNKKSKNHRKNHR